MKVRALTRAGQEKAHGPGDRNRHVTATVLLVCGAALCLVVVFGFGLAQFKHRAAGPIDIVRNAPIDGTDTSIGNGILDYLGSHGVKVVTEGFKPTWGAEQVSSDRWVVSYVYEVGRESQWVSWTVDMKSGGIQPGNALARRIQSGD
jgi:hypothetical protein